MGSFQGQIDILKDKTAKLQMQVLETVFGILLHAGH